MKPRVSKLMLTSHITFSVGWLGAVVVFLVLAITGLNSQDIQLARACSLAMKSSAWLVIVPFCIISLFTGIAQALFTKWGLFKHYWIIVKLFLTVVCTLLLLLHLQPINYLAGVATKASFSNTQQSEQFINLIAKAGAAVLVLVAITTISVYKPWGKVQFATQSKNQVNNIQNDKNKNAKPLIFYVRIALVVLLLILIIKHLLSGGMHGH